MDPIFAQPLFIESWPQQRSAGLYGVPVSFQDFSDGFVPLEYFWPAILFWEGSQLL